MNEINIMRIQNHYAYSNLIIHASTSKRQDNGKKTKRVKYKHDVNNELPRGQTPTAKTASK